MCYFPKVCTLLAETWCIHRPTIFYKTKLERLGYQPNAYEVQKFWELCQLQFNDSGNPNKYAKDGGLTNFMFLNFYLKQIITLETKNYIFTVYNQYERKGKYNRDNISPQG